MWKLKKKSEDPDSMRTQDFYIWVDEHGALPDSFGEDFESFAAERLRKPSTWGGRLKFASKSDTDTDHECTPVHTPEQCAALFGEGTALGCAMDDVDKMPPSVVVKLDEKKE